MVSSLAAAATPSAQAHAASIDRDFGKVPLSFEPNRGQTSPEIQFLSRGRGYALYLTQGEAVLELQKSTGKKEKAGLLDQSGAESSTLRMKLLGAKPTVAFKGEDLLPGTVNYFEGSDSKQWKTAIPTYKRVSYQSVYPGIDVVYYGNQRQLEYDFIVAPGADASQIGLGFTGASPRIDARTGDLVLAINDGETRFHAPVVYQREGDRKLPVQGSYTLADGQVHFKLGNYDHARELVIDPVLSYMTYLGGSADDQIHGMAVDASGNVIVVGTTYSTDFPLKSAYSSVPPQDYRTPTMFISKFNATGTALIYSTYLGVSTFGNAVAVDPSGNAYAFGTTNDSNYPVTPGAYQTICGANYDQATGARITGCSAIFVSGNNSTVVTKIGPDGQTLVYSTYLSGRYGNVASAITVNSAGEAYVAGTSNASCDGNVPAYFCFPITSNAADPTQYPLRPNSSIGLNSGDTYMFFTKLNAQGSGLVYSTTLYNHNTAGHYVTGIQPTAIALDSSGNAYITGTAGSQYLFNTTPGAFQTSTNPGSSAAGFVLKFNPAGTASTSLAYSTYLSGTSVSGDSATGIVVDSSRNAIVTGSTNSCTFPTTAGSFSNVPNGYLSANNCQGGFLTKLNAAGSALVWSTWTSNLGANGRTNDGNNALALAPDGSIYVVAYNNGTALYPTVNPIFTQSESGFTSIKHFTADGASLVFSSAIGGTTDATSIPSAVALDPSGNIYIAGNTNSSTWPTTTGAFQKNSANPGVNYNDGFVVKIAPLSTSTTTLTVSTATAAFGQSVTLTATVVGPTGGSIPTGTVTFKNGSNTLGTGTLDATGKATYTSSTLSPNTYSLTASYVGDTTYSSSVSAAQPLSITAVGTSTALTITPAAAFTGQTVSLSAKVTPTSGSTVPTGTITFRNGATVLGAIALDSTGKATLSSSSLAAATYSITAVYSGDTTYAVSTSATGALVVAAPLTSATTLTASATTGVVGIGITFTAQVTPASGSTVATGTVTFRDGSTTLGTGTLDATGKATYTNSALTAGSHSIVAAYGGDSGNAASTSAALAITITAGAPDFTLTLSSSSGNASLKQINAQASPLVRIATTTATVTPVYGFNAATTFSCTGLPTYSTCTFAPASVTPSGSPVTSTVTITTDVAKSNLITGFQSSNRPWHGLPLVPAGGSAAVLAILCWTGFGTRKARKHLVRCLTAVLTLTAIAGGITGCGDKAVKTPAGSYAIVITATAGATTHNATYTLTVTQ